MITSHSELSDFLNIAYDRYNRETFITDDPISVPHSFTTKEDIEISAFLTATISWGQRATIIKNAKKLVELMGNSPHQFILSDFEEQLPQFELFKHRTFNFQDLEFFFRSLRIIYRNHGGLENVFQLNKNDVKASLEYFNTLFLSVEHDKRSEKHIANPLKGSAAKRLNMFLRWMVRNDNRGVDFGIWDSIPSSALMIPLDVHSGNVARKLGLLKRKQNDWLAVEELTDSLRKFDPYDPVKYDYALFGLGVYEKF